MTDQELNEAVVRKLGKGHIQEGWEKVCVIPDYCHSIQAAWEMVEKLDYCKLVKAASSFRCQVSIGGEPCNFYADTAPRAICLAFLKLPI